MAESYRQVIHILTNKIMQTYVRKVLLIVLLLCYYNIKEFRTSVFAVGRVHMSNEECKQCIIDMIRRIDDEALLRRIYLILVVMTGADE